MATIQLDETVKDDGHDSASEAARRAEAEREAAAAAAAGDERRRSPRYNVFEEVETYSRGQTHKIKGMVGTVDEKGVIVHEIAPEGEGRSRAVSVHATGEKLTAWVLIAENVSAPTGGHAIDSVTGTAETPVEGFDADRRLHPFCAVLVGDWKPRQRVRTVTEGWA